MFVRVPPHLAVKSKKKITVCLVMLILNIWHMITSKTYFPFYPHDPQAVKFITVKTHLMKERKKIIHIRTKCLIHAVCSL